MQNKSNKVTFKETVSSLHGSYHKGKTYDVPADFADEMIRAEFATAEVKTAVHNEPETRSNSEEQKDESVEPVKKKASKKKAE